MPSGAFDRVHLILNSINRFRIVKVETGDFLGLCFFSILPVPVILPITRA
jgi:hypothetical protein